MNETKKRSAEVFKKAFNKEPEITVFSPGRVNLIGEHIDYNGGKVLPCSLSIGTYGAASKENEGKIKLVSESFPESVYETDTETLRNMKDDPSSFGRFGWAAYALGAARKLMDRGFNIQGFSIAVSSDLPKGSGLSSSASIEVLTCAVLDRLFSLGLDGVTAAKVSLEAERDCVGVNCGIMDQFVCAMGRKDSAVLLDTSTLEYEYIPFELQGGKLLIMNTEKPRRLADSKYNERRAECGEAEEIINRRIDIKGKGLCGIDPGEFERVKSELYGSILKRARHAVTENQRTKDAVKALEKGDMPAFGKLLNASHDSLRNDYEVTGRELDTLVSAARAQKNVLGARMTGAGFGGCAIALVNGQFDDEAIENIEDIYKKEIGYDCSVFIAGTEDAPFSRK